MTTDAGLIPLQQAQAPHLLRYLALATTDGQRARTMVQRRLRPASARWEPAIRRHTGDDTRPLRSPVESPRHGRPRQSEDVAPARPARDMDQPAIAPGADWEEHDEQAVWQEIDD